MNDNEIVLKSALLGVITGGITTLLKKDKLNDTQVKRLVSFVSEYKTKSDDFLAIVIKEIEKRGIEYKE